MENDLQLQVNELKRTLDALQAEYYTNNFTGSQDFQKYSRFNTRLKLPVLAVAPSTCEQGELYVNSTGGKVYVCTTTNTWSLIGTQS